MLELLECPKSKAHITSELHHTDHKQHLVHIAFLKSSCHAAGGAFARLQHAWTAHVAQNQGTHHLRPLETTYKHNCIHLAYLTFSSCHATG